MEMAPLILAPQHFELNLHQLTAPGPVLDAWSVMMMSCVLLSYIKSRIIFQSKLPAYVPELPWPVCGHLVTGAPRERSGDLAHVLKLIYSVGSEQIS